MYDREFRVRFITSRNNFIFLSERDARLFDTEHVIRLTYGYDKTACFSLGPPLPNIQEGEVALSSVLARELGLYRSDVVTLSSTPYIRSVKRLSLQVETNDDYEMLETLADNVQSTLLSQVRVVHNNQKLVIWLSSSLHITVTADGVLPSSPGKLENLTAVSLIPPISQHNNNCPVPTSYFYRKQPSFSAKTDSILNTYEFGTQSVCRLHPIHHLEEIHDDCRIYFEQPFNIFIPKHLLPLNIDNALSTTKQIILINLRLIRVLDVRDLVSNNEQQNIVVRVFALEDVCQSSIEAGIAFANDFLFNQLNTKPGAKIILESINDLSQQTVRAVKIVTRSKFFSKAEELVKKYLGDFCENGGSIVVNSHVIFAESSGCEFSLAFTPELPYCLIDSQFIRYNRFQINDAELEQQAPPKRTTKIVDDDMRLELDCGNLRQLIDSVEKCTLMKLLSHRKITSNVLITGKIGSGKSTLLNYLSENAIKPPHYFHVEFVECKKLKGKNIESLHKVLNGILLNLIYYQPAMLMLDDLHVICEKVVEGDVPTQESLHFNKVSEMLAEVLENCTLINSIAIVATAESTLKLNENIFASRGKHMFKNVFSLNDLNKCDRTNMLKFLFESKELSTSSVDFETLGVKTEGFVVQDLVDYVDKIIFEAYKTETSSDHLCINSEHCENALKTTSTLSLREVRLHSPGERDFNDIGGLDDVKKIMVECMMWPAQYPNIFGRAPLRLQSGVLLYGPPGTGKTILAGAAAKHCNLRLISVKGPELLSKYIGASEQAVRDIFEKAQSAKPCILFFDEFDSLAPRRGHDNTGVTDRVVNQFLTQLDGVESLVGVCVLAATSRPDLLDPALLRPGRLDRQLFCPMPDRDARLAIIGALSKCLHLAEDVDLAKLADETEGYSGADLQAVLYTAQLNCVEHLLDDNEAAKGDDGKINFIERQHLCDALRTTRPSLTRDEKMRYERIINLS